MRVIDPELNDYDAIIAYIPHRDTKHIATDITKLLLESTEEFSLYQKFEPFNCLLVEMNGDGFSGWVNTTFQSGHLHNTVFRKRYGLDHELMFPIGYDADGDHSDEFFDYLKKYPKYESYLQARSEIDSSKRGTAWLYGEKTISFKGNEFPSREIFAAVAIVDVIDKINLIRDELLEQPDFINYPKGLPFTLLIKTRGNFNTRKNTPSIGYDAFRYLDMSYNLEIFTVDNIGNYSNAPELLKSAQRLLPSEEECFNYHFSFINEPDAAEQHLALATLINSKPTYFEHLMSHLTELYNRFLQRDYNDYFSVDPVPELIFALNILLQLDPQKYEKKIQLFLYQCLQLPAPKFDGDYIEQINQVMDRALPYLLMVFNPAFSVLPTNLDVAIVELQQEALIRIENAHEHPIIKVLALELADCKKLLFTKRHGQYSHSSTSYIQTITDEYVEQVEKLARLFLQRVIDGAYNGIEKTIVLTRLKKLHDRLPELLTEVKNALE